MRAFPDESILPLSAMPLLRLSSCLLALAAPFALAGCGSGNSGGSSSQSSNQWTWVAGSNVINQNGNYGVQGSPSFITTPGGRSGESSWIDAAGNFWLFGGIGQAATTPTAHGYLNDMWQYRAGQWTWIGGTNHYFASGIYGVKGTPAATNFPGGRWHAASWTDSSGNFWLFGGQGVDANGVSNVLNDLWEFNSAAGTAGQWIWVGGASSGVSQVGVYGAKGTPAAANFPGARAYATTWTDRSGNFWLFGGVGVDSANTFGDLDDLWKLSAGQWTWVAGSNLASVPATYGAQGTAASANDPGARCCAAGWADASGALWLFGGAYGASGNATFLQSDLWKFSGSQWTWVSGPNTPNQPGSYGTQGTPAASNTPAALLSPIAWTTPNGDMWLFGGQSSWNDLWRYRSGQWAWLGGALPTSSPPAGNYGFQGVTASSSLPGGRAAGVGWADTSGNLWLFGGSGADSTAAPGDLNDLWQYQP